MMHTNIQSNVLNIHDIHSNFAGDIKLSNFNALFSWPLSFPNDIKLVSWSFHVLRPISMWVLWQMFIRNSDLNICVNKLK